MGCCASHEAGAGGKSKKGGDKVVEEERKLGLHECAIADFQRILKEGAGDREITVTELGEAFKAYSFGQALLAEGDNAAKKLISHSIFQGRGGDLDWLHLFMIGLLYAKGNAAQKVDSMLLTYDTNGDGIIFTTSMKKILTDLVTIAGVIMPAIVANVDFEEADAQGGEAVDTLVSDTNGIIFGNELQVDAARIKKVFGKEVNYVLNSAKLRNKFPVKIGAEKAEA